MTTVGEQGLRITKEPVGKFRSEGVLNSSGMESIFITHHAAGLSPTEINTLDRMQEAGLNPYNVDTDLTTGQYVAQQYITRTLASGKKPNPKVIQELIRD